MTRRKDIPKPISTKLIISIFLTNHTKLAAFSPSLLALPALLVGTSGRDFFLLFLTPPSHSQNGLELLRWVFLPRLEIPGTKTRLTPASSSALVGSFLPLQGALRKENGGGKEKKHYHYDVLLA